MSETVFNNFINEYYYLLEDTWRKSENDATLRNEIDEWQYRILNKGDVEWNEYIEEIIQAAGQYKHLLGLISFHFEDKEYNGPADFNGYNFAFRTYFKGCIFHKKFTIYQGSISATLNFMNTIFHESIEIVETNFSSNLEFIHCKFNNDFILSRCEVNRDIIFVDNCKFSKSAKFVSSIFTMSLLLGDSIFKKCLPDLRETSFSKSVDLVSIEYDEHIIYQTIKMKKNEFDNFKSHFDDGISIFNRLKTIADSNGDHKNTKNFFALSLKVNSLLEPWYQSFITKLYGITSDFARSISRPLISLGTLTLIIFLINHYSVNTESTLCGNMYKNEWILTIQRSIPFGIGFDESTLSCAKEIYGVNKSPPVLIQIVNMIQVLFSYVFWFLFVLAIRNRFRI